LKTKEQELGSLLDLVFDSAEEPDWAAVQEQAYLSANRTWLITELFRLMWLCSEDGAAFDEEIWRLTNTAWALHEAQ
jgi:hypothetical protein